MGLNEEKIEKFKKIVDDMFEELNRSEKGTRTSGKSLKRKVFDEKKAKKARQTNSSNVAEKDPADMALDCALNELEEVRDAFLDFQDDIEDLAIFEFIYPKIEDFVESCLDLIEIMEDDFDADALEGKTLEQYQNMQKLRARILSAMYIKYKKK